MTVSPAEARNQRVAKFQAVVESICSDIDSKLTSPSTKREKDGSIKVKVLFCNSTRMANEIARVFRNNRWVVSYRKKGTVYFFYFKEK